MIKQPRMWQSRPLWRWFQLPFAVRVFALYFVFVGLSGYFMLSLVVDEVKPGVRQSTEEVLFDTAQILANLVAPSFTQSPNGQLPQQLQALLASYGQHQTPATIWGIPKTPPSIAFMSRISKALSYMTAPTLRLGRITRVGMMCI